MVLPKSNETPQEEPQGKPKGPSTTRAVHVMPARQPATLSLKGKPAAAAGTDQPAAPPAEKAAPPANGKPSRSGKGINPGKKLSSIEIAARNAPRLKIPWKYRLRPDFGLARRAAWDVSAIASLLVNAVLLTVVIILAFQVKTLKGTVNGLLGGLYDNFVRMDNSVISTTINVPELSIPLNFTLPVVQEETYVTLTRDVTIRNAIVGVLSQPTTVVLPRGTSLPVSLNMNVQVNTTVVVKDVKVPVTIQLATANSPDPNVANLHGAFIGLQNTVGPFYCLLDPGAKDYTGAFICLQGTYVPKPTR
ncbi:MAG: hypothetical protein FD146_911 [Anaerolineaceae bacterium]|nr:MAG: hypothetical protein FD146_911 [Anaerolineaceae bacterium]